MSRFGRTFPMPVFVRRPRLTAGTSTTRNLTDTGFYQGASGSDTFTRGASSGAGWGTASSGFSWTQTQGAAGVTALTGTTGTLAPPAAQTESMVDGVQNYDLEAQIDITWSSDAVGGSQSAGIYLRWTDSNNNIRTALNCPAGSTTVGVVLTKVVGSVVTQLKAVNVGTITAGTNYTLKVRVAGVNVFGKAWQVGSGEPTSWLSVGALASLDEVLPGSTGVRGFVQTGNTNLPTFTYDNFSVTPLGDYISVTAGRQLADTISVSDSLSATKTGGTQTTRNLSDTISISDSLPMAVKRFISDTISISDVLPVKPVRPLADTISFTDVLVPRTTRVLSDTISVSDVLVPRATRPLTDTISLSDALVKSAVKVLSDTISVSDVLVPRPTRPMADAITITDAIGRALKPGVSDTISISDSLPMRVTRGPADTITLSDQVGRGRGLLDNGTLLTQVARTDNYTRGASSGAGWGTGSSGFPWTQTSGSISETALTGTTGTLSPGAGVQDVMTDGSTVLDVDAQLDITWSSAAVGGAQQQGVALRLKDVNNTIRIYHQQSAGGTGFNLFVAKVIAGVSTTLANFSALGTYSLGSMYTIKVSIRGANIFAKTWIVGNAEPEWQAIGQLASAGEVVQGLAGVRVNLNAANSNLPTFTIDNYSSTPVVEWIGTNVIRPLADTISISDSLVATKSGGFTRNLSDTISISDSLPVAVKRFPTDTISISEALVKGPHANPSDTITITDLLPRKVTRVISDTISVTDGVQRGRKFSDTITISDSLTFAHYPRTSRWLYDQRYEGCMVGVGAQANRIPADETYMGNTRQFWLSHAVASDGPFNPTGRDELGNLVETPVDWTKWYGYINNGDGTGFSGGVNVGHPVDIVFHILGIRTGDATWPSGGFTDMYNWVYGDNSYVDQCVTAWANIMKTVPRYQLTRMWHEMGQPTNPYFIASGSPKDPYIDNWQKIVTRLRQLGALGDPVGPNQGAMGIVWCPAGGLDNGGTPVRTDYWVGQTYTDWIGIDAYNFQAGANTDPKEFSTSFYDYYTQYPNPIMVCETGIHQTDANRIKHIKEWAYLLETKYPRVKALIYWDGASNDMDDTPTGFQAAFTDAFNDAYFLPDGIIGPYPTDYITFKESLTPATRLTDSISISDAIQRKIVRNLSDTISITDGLGPRTRAVSDTISFSDSILRVVKRVISDTITISDGTLARGRGLTDTISFTDSIQRKPQRGLADTITLSDTLPMKVTRQLADGITITDTLVPTKTTHGLITRNLIDVGAFDGLLTDPGLNTDSTLGTAGGEEWLQPTTKRLLSDTISISDGSVQRGRGLADTISFTDSIRLATKRLLSDTIAVSDGLVPDPTRKPTDTISFSDSIQKRASKVLADTIAVSDSLTPRVTRVLSDTIAVSDSLVRTAVRPLIDTISVSESLVKLASKFPSDTIAVSDVLVPRTTRVLADTITVSDSLVRGGAKNVNLSDTISISDGIARTVGRPLADTISVTDGIAPVGSHPLSDTISFTDAILRRVQRGITDTISVSDGSVQRGRGLADTTGSFTDSVLRRISRPLSDSISMSDGIGGSGFHTVSPTDTISFSDSILRKRISALSDLFLVTDGIAQSTRRGLSDVLAITDSLSHVSLHGLTDGFSVFDGITRFETRQPSDSFSITDLLSKRATHGLIDGFTITDGAVTSLGGQKAIQDFVFLSDTIATTRTRAIADVIPVSDVLIRSYMYFQHPASFTSVTFPTVTFVSDTFLATVFMARTFESVDLVPVGS